MKSQILPCLAQGEPVLPHVRDGRIQGAAEGSLRAWLSTAGRGSFPAHVWMFKPQGIFVLLLCSQWLFPAMIQGNLCLDFSSLASLLCSLPVPLGMGVGTSGISSPAFLLFPPVDISSPDLPVTHWMITACLWLGHTSDFVNQKLPSRAIQLLLGVYHLTCFWVCILAPPAPL